MTDRSPDRKGLVERLGQAVEFVMALGTPPRPEPSAWTDAAWCEHWRQKRLATAQSIREAADALATQETREQVIADRVVQEVAELPDRTSPEDWPEAMLVTADELRCIVAAALRPAAPAPKDTPLCPTCAHDGNTVPGPCCTGESVAGDVQYDASAPGTAEEPKAIPWKLLVFHCPTCKSPVRDRGVFADVCADDWHDYKTGTTTNCRWSSV